LRKTSFSFQAKSRIIAPIFHPHTKNDPRGHFFVFIPLANKENMNIQSILDTTLPGLGYELVDHELTAQGTLRVFIDKAGGITVDDFRVAGGLVLLTISLGMLSGRGASDIYAVYLGFLARLYMGGTTKTPTTTRGA